jgi:hypothetical protein
MKIRTNRRIESHKYIGGGVKLKGVKERGNGWFNNKLDWR